MQNRTCLRIISAVTALIFVVILLTPAWSQDAATVSKIKDQFKFGEEFAKLTIGKNTYSLFLLLEGGSIFFAVKDGKNAEVYREDMKYPPEFVKDINPGEPLQRVSERDELKIEKGTIIFPIYRYTSNKIEDGRAKKVFMHLRNIPVPNLP